MEQAERVEKGKVTIFLLIFSLLFFCQRGYSGALDVSELCQIWPLFTLNKSPQNARLWKNNSLCLVNIKQDKKQLLLTVLIPILNTMAVENESDTQAYQVWETSQTCLLKNKFRWRELQNAIKAIYQEKGNCLSQVSSEHSHVGISLLASQNSSLLLIEREHKLALNYDEKSEPRLYHSVTIKQNNEINNRLTARRYLARPTVSPSIAVEWITSATSRDFNNETIDEQSTNAVELIDDDGLDMPEIDNNSFNIELNITPFLAAKDHSPGLGPVVQEVLPLSNSTIDTKAQIISPVIGGGLQGSLSSKLDEASCYQNLKVAKA